jgi:hypothetical protein
MSRYAQTQTYDDDLREAALRINPDSVEVVVLAGLSI